MQNADRIFTCVECKIATFPPESSFPKHALVPFMAISV